MSNCYDECNLFQSFYIKMSKIMVHYLSPDDKIASECRVFGKTKFQSYG